MHLDEMKWRRRWKTFRNSPFRPVWANTHGRPRSALRAAAQAWCGLETLESRVYLAFDPTGLEQEMLEYVNRMRINPEAELSLLINSDDADVNAAIDFFNVDLDVLADQWDDLLPVAPVAWHESLYNAARDHSQVMILQDSQTHQGDDEPSLGQRITDAGYNWSTIGENVFAFTERPFHGHAGFAIDWGFDDPEDGDGIQEGFGHRVNIMNGAFREIGIGILEDNDNTTDVGPLVVTQDFGNRNPFGNPYLLGVVFDDTSGNGFYNAGEGLGGVTVDIDGDGGTFQTLTMTAGGYQLQVPAGTYDVTFSGGGLGSPQVRQVTIGAANIKQDLNIGELPSVQFTSAFYSVGEAGGMAMISLTRTGDDGVPFDVTITTANGTATAGEDYTATMQVLSFDAGETVKVFNIIPITDDGEEEPSETVNLTLSMPTGGVTLGALTAATLTILDNDDTTGPRITEMEPLLTGKKGNKFTGIVLTFDEPLDEASAQSLGNYGLFLVGKDKVLGTADDKPVALQAAIYNDAAGTVTVMPLKPLKFGKQVRLVVDGSASVTDVQGNRLDGEFAGDFPSGNGAPGGDFVADAALGKKVAYMDANGDKVTLQLKKGGLIAVIFGTDGDAHAVDLLDTIAGTSILTGKVKLNKKAPGSDGMTTIGLLNLPDGVTNLLTEPSFEIGMIV